MNKKIKIAFASMLAVPLLACAQVRTEQTFEKGWKFHIAARTWYPKYPLHRTEASENEEDRKSVV